MRNRISNTAKQIKCIQNDPIDLESSDMSQSDRYDEQPIACGLDKAGKLWVGRFSEYPTTTAENDYGGESSFLSQNSLNEDGQRIEIKTKEGDNISTRYERFSSYKFKQALNNGIVHFTYRKVNGKMRDAYVTTNIRILLQNHCKMQTDRRYNNVHNIRYYDMYSKGWRSFKPNNLTTIYQVIETPKSDNQNNQNDNQPHK